MTSAGSAKGGAAYAAGAAGISNSTFEANKVVAPVGLSQALTDGGSYLCGGGLTLTNDTITDNTSTTDSTAANVHFVAAEVCPTRWLLTAWLPAACSIASAL